MGLRELATAKPQVKQVDTPLGSYFVKRLCGAERLSLEFEDRAQWSLGIVCRSACDAEGKREFKDAETALVAALDHEVFELLFAEAMQLNGFSKQAVDEAKKA